MNKNLITFFLLTLFLTTSCVSKQDQYTNVEIAYEDGYNFFVANDLGRNGYYQQKAVAKVMGELAEDIDIEFIADAGDTHHWNGVQSVHDPLWMTNFETIYDHPELMVEWYAILGNHEYHGNTQALIDYSNISRRWVMPARYYTKTIVPDEGDEDEYSTVKVFFIDTTPLIDKYYEEGDEYPDVLNQDSTLQLRWLEEELAKSTEQFKIVIGHHPIYVSEKKRVDEQSLIEKLDPLLRKYNIDLYVAGHSHTFQHLTKPGTNINYVVNGSASLSREPIKGPDTRFCSSDEGFSIISIGKDKLKMTFINYLGNPIYQFEVKK
ncbi:MAG: Calcineurin-like phosphoesterase [Bacteroidetes bacterium ADurb.Bin174]|nr:MAG: Calcineurin-like phosphoesterase [Bacteroidetes bacterium ADurb.Bin174]